MKSNSEMTRWTRPTNEAFYALHKDAIGFYTTLALIVQVIWLIFSIKPTADLLSGALADFGVTVVATKYLATALLAFLHWELHRLIKYIFYNALDDDPNTVSSFMHYIVASLIVLVMLAADIMGTSAFFRDDEKFVGLSTQNETAKKEDEAKRLNRYSSDSTTLRQAATEQVVAIRSSFAAKRNKIVSRSTYDDADRRKKNADLNTCDRQRDDQIGAIQNQFAEDSRRLLADKNSDLSQIGNIYRTKGQRITSADDDNAAKSNQYGWIISICCVCILLGCTYQITILRVGAGQKPISRFTISDATGSFGSKLYDAITDILQRWGHKLVYNVHAFLTIKELDALDGSFQIKSGDTDVVPMNGGGGGGSTPFTFTKSTTPSVAAAKTTPIGFNRDESGNVKSATPIEKKEVKTEAIELLIPKVSDKMHYSDWSKAEKDKKAQSLANFFDVPISYCYKALEQENPVLDKIGDEWVLYRTGQMPVWEHICKSYNQDNPCQITGTHFALVSGSRVRLQNGEVRPYPIEIRAGHGLPCKSIIKDHILVKLEDVEENQHDKVHSIFSKMDIENPWGVTKTQTPTPSSLLNDKKAETTPVNVPQIENPVPQPKHAEYVPTELDDKLVMLKMKLQKEGESNFTNTQSENETVKNRITRILDEASRALLNKTATCDAAILSDFYKVAQAKLALMQKHKCSDYDAAADFHTLVINRLNKAHKEGRDG